jgi:uncharacterized protein YecE (DUF72 family)
MSEYREPRIGTVGFDGPPPRTYAKLSLVELQESFTGSPSTKSLGRLRKSAGQDFSIVLRAPAALSHAGERTMERLKLSYLPEGQRPAKPLDTGELGRRVWEWTLAAAQTLGAEAIFLQSPASFRPTPQNRARLAAFVEQVRGADGPPLLWDSQGLWELADLAAACRDLGLIPCYDPLLETTPLAGDAYLRVLGRARSHHGLSIDELDRLADAAAASDTPRVALHTPTPFRDACALVKAITGR